MALAEWSSGHYRVWEGKRDAKADPLHPAPGGFFLWPHGEAGAYLTKLVAVKLGVCNWNYSTAR